MMKNLRLVAISGLLAIPVLLTTALHARTIVVTTADNLAPPGGQTSLLQALTGLQDGDVVQFNLPGPGPHFIETPPEGYPLITRQGVQIDGYSQPGAAPNTQTILGTNNAQVRIVLDSRNGNSRLMDFPPDSPNDSTGYGNSESAILGVLGVNGVDLRGLGFLGVPLTGVGQGVQMYAVSFAKGASGRVRGCWFGVAPDGVTLAGTSAGITGFQYLSRDPEGQVLQSLLVNNVVIGVARDATNAPADFNVMAAIPGIPIIIEGDGTRIAGNFLGVLPDSVHDVNLSLDPAYAGAFEGFIEIGRGGNSTLIGTDGDGVNDANERNVLGGTLPALYGGYDHSIEFYDPNPGTNIIVAGNLFGIGVDLTTTFTNGVPALNAAGAQAVYRFGSNLDGQSDDLEGNVVYNNWPEVLFNQGFFDALYPDGLNFFSELELNGLVSARGNTLVNNLPFPASPTRWDAGVPGTWLTNFYAKALADPNAGVHPVISSNSTTTLLLGSVPIADGTRFPVTVLDLYVADPSGISTGLGQQWPELPHGFVQGRAYLESFVVDGPEDLDAAPGAFQFDISALGLTDALLTATANYASGPPAEPASRVLTSPFSNPVQVQGPAAELEFTAIAVTPEGLRLEWTGGGTLQATTDVASGWQDLTGATSPYTIPASGNAGFFRLRK